MADAIDVGKQDGHLSGSSFGVTELFLVPVRRGQLAAVLLASMPVKLITRPQPGLFGAAAAFARQYR